MDVLYLLNALEGAEIERLLSQVCATDRRHISQVLAYEELTEQTITYDTQEVDREAGEPGTGRLVFAQELQVFRARRPDVSALDFAWRFHHATRSAVSINAQSTWIDEYLLLQENHCYLARDVSATDNGLAIKPADCIPMDHEKLFAFWGDMERAALEGGYILREYNWWRNL